MLDEPIRPVQPVDGVRTLSPVALPRHPSYGQLQKWLSFSKRLSARKAKRGKNGQADSEPPPELPTARQGDDHIDEYA